MFYPRSLSGRFARLTQTGLWADRRGSAGIIFGLAALPMIMLIGASLDYSRASIAKSRLQQAVDGALIASVTRATADDRAGAAKNAFNTWAPSSGGVTATATFSSTDTTLSGTASATVTTYFMGLAHVSTLTVKASGSVDVPTSTDWGTCIVTLGNGLSASSSALTLNGSPNVSLNGCGVWSNASMTCNGHSGGASSSKAVGPVSNCSNPEPNSPAWQDIYASLASKISTSCAGSGGVTWTVGTLPTGSNFITVTKTGYTEYHVCGALTLKGSGTLLSGGVVVIENGDLNVDDKASITATDTTFVLTGTNSGSHVLTFPNGNGKASTLTVQAPKSSTHPWRGIAIYLDPSLTSNVDATLGSGATLNYDGVVYLPHSDVTYRGNMGSSISKCSVLVVDTLTSNGSPVLSLNQSETACVAAGVATKKRPPRLKS